MKKIYATLAAVLTLSVSASAQPQCKEWPAGSVEIPAAQSETTRIEGKNVLDFGWNNDLSGGFACFSGQNMGKHSGAIQLPAEVTSQFDGKKIIAVKLNAGIYCNVEKYTLFATNDLDGERIMTEDVLMKSPAQMEWVRFPLANPVTIEGGKDLFVGFDMEVENFKQEAFWVDKVPKDQGYGCWVNYRHSGIASGWVDFNYYYGSLLLRVEIEDVVLPDYDGSISGLDMMSYVQLGSPFDIGVRVINKGLKPLKSVTLRYQIGELEPKEATLQLVHPTTYQPLEVGYNAVGIANISDLVYGEESPAVPVKIELLKVNGRDDPTENGNTYTSAFLSMANEGYKRAMLMEEVTGTWCGNCPRGIVTIHDMLAKYGPEFFIPVAVHCGSDPMTCADYNSFVSKYTGLAAPTAMYNRNTNYEVALTGFGQVERIYKQITSQAALARIELMAEWANDEHTAIRAYTTTNFSGAAEKEFRLAFVITENGVGPYSQSNYYAGGQEMGGWEKLTSRVDTTFNEVARILDSFEGIEGSLPANGVEREKDYKFVREISLAKLKQTEDFNIIAMVIDVESGEVVNARSLPSADIALTSIADVSASTAEGPAEYFDLQGRRVENPAHGIFLRRTGNSTQKVRF